MNVFPALVGAMEQLEQVSVEPKEDTYQQLKENDHYQWSPTLDVAIHRDRMKPVYHVDYPYFGP